MNVYHVSPVYNQKSIFQNGLVPTSIKLPQHKRRFEQRGLLDKNNNGLYVWEDSPKNDKFIVDMVYCIVWIQPRNDLIDVENDHFPDFRKVTNKPLYPYSQMEFDVYSFEVKKKSFNEFLHTQEPDDDINSSLYNMDEKYAHDDKKMVVLNKKYHPKIVGRVSYYYDKSGINIKIRK